MSITELRAKLRTAGVKVSYTSVWKSAHGEGPAKPNLRLTDGLARVFGVRRDWLLTGEAPRTEDELEMRRRAESAETDDLYDRVRTAIPELDDLDFAVSAAFMTYLHRWVRANFRAGLPVDDKELIEEIARGVWEWAMEPFNAWGRRTGNNPLMLNQYGVSDYLMAVLHALNFSLQIAEPPTDEPTLEE